MKRIPAEGLIGEAVLREARSTELREVMDLVRSALVMHLNREVWLQAIYPDRAIVILQNKLLAYPYVLADENKISFGDPVEVVVDHVPTTAVREAAGSVPLGGEAKADAAGVFLEALAADAGKPARYLVRVIRSGESLNGVNYPPAVLREAAPLFDGVRVFVKSDEEHLAGRGKDVRQLVGRLSEPRFVEAKGGGEIRAVLDVLETAPIAAQLREAVARGMADLFGLSIDATGAEKKKGKFREATRIVAVASVDLIVEPGAGGQFIRFTESKAHKEPDMLRQQMITAIAAILPAVAAGLADASDDQVLTAYREAFAAPSTPAGVTSEDLQRTVHLVEARADARVLIAGSKLPQKARDRLTVRFTEATDFTLDDVKTAITEEETYVDSLRESAPVTGLGALRLEAGEDRAEKVQSMLDGFFRGERDGFRSFREAYVEITGDSGITGQFRACDEVRLREAAGARFREAVSAATFNDILGDSITRQMLREYNENPLYSDWRFLVDTVPTRDFRTNERTRMGGYGNLPAVAENAAYAALTTPDDEKATYAISKRGGTETISLEAIANDDVGVIRRIPSKLGVAAARTLFEFVWDFVATNPNIYDGLALFVAGHANIGTAALDATALAAARLRMAKQAEAGSSKRLGLVMRHLLVPADLEETARNLFTRGTNNDPTFVQTLNPTIHVSPYWTDTNNWFVTADRSQIPLIELGFFNGNEEPELFVQDSPTQGSLFSNDQIKYKIRHVYGGNVMDYRGFDGSIVA